MFFFAILVLLVFLFGLGWDIENEYCCRILVEQVIYAIIGYVILLRLSSSNFTCSTCIAGYESPKLRYGKLSCHFSSFSLCVLLSPQINLFLIKTNSFHIIIFGLGGIC
jgi:hypothetical protein